MGGRVMCAAAGSVVVSAGSMGQTATTTVTCMAVAVLGLYLVPSDSSIQSGMRLQYYAFAKLANGMDSNVTAMATWSSDNNAVATVQNAGLLRGEVRTSTPGKAVISAMYQTMTAKATLTVTP
jgi:hypothetical protein